MKNLLEIEIGEIWVEGEISNLRRQASGHCYFSLKDEGAQISCVLFRGNATRVKAQPENGMQARIFGEISVYEARGQVQLIIKQVEDAGLGDLQARFEALKRKLDQEGLFDPAFKKPLPKFPRVVGLVTSPTGAALQDMLNILARRAPWVQPVLYPVTVQGKGAEAGIARAIDQLGNPEEYDLPRVDVIIIGRGGGSLEDLWNFNEEVVARAIHSCPIPLVSAVGHEIDFTISDFTADVRAPTPSAAAELVVPDSEELSEKVSRYSSALLRVVENKLTHATTTLASARRALIPRDAESALRDPIQDLDRMRVNLDNAVETEVGLLSNRIREASLLHMAHHPTRMIQQHGEQVNHIKTQLDRTAGNAIIKMEDSLKNVKSLIRTLGPESTFARGFSITMDSKGNILTESSQVAEGEILETKLSEGSLLSKVSLSSSLKTPPR